VHDMSEWGPWCCELIWKKYDECFETKSCPKIRIGQNPAKTLVILIFFFLKDCGGLMSDGLIWHLGHVSRRRHSQEDLPWPQNCCMTFVAIRRGPD
jgi:hypothetical protein